MGSRLYEKKIAGLLPRTPLGGDPRTPQNEGWEGGEEPIGPGSPLAKWARLIEP